MKSPSMRLGLIAFCIAAAFAGAQPQTPTPPSNPRADFLKLIDRPRVDPAPEVQPASNPDDKGLVEIRFSLAVQQGRRMPGTVVKSAKAAGRLPVLIVLHGTGGNQRSLLGFAREMASHGCIGVVVDAPYHGQRADERAGHASYDDAILRAYLDAGDSKQNASPAEHPFFYDTVWDVMRLVDWLATRDDVEPARIGLYGVSKGGIETYLAAAADPRIAVAVPAIGVQSFRWALEHNQWQSRIGTVQSAYDRAAQSAGKKAGKDFTGAFYDRVVPHIVDEFDGPSMLPLIAPRPLLTINGDSDGRTPLPGLQECTDAAKAAYQAAGAADRFETMIEKNTGHKVNPDAEQAAVNWFVRWLKPKTIEP